MENMIQFKVQKQDEFLKTLKKEGVHIELSVNEYYNQLEQLYEQFIDELNINIQDSSVYFTLDYLTQIEALFRDLFKRFNASFLYDMFPDIILLNSYSHKKHKSIRDVNAHFIERVNEFISTIKHNIEFKIVNKIFNTGNYIKQLFTWKGKITSFLEIFYSISQTGFVLKSNGEPYKYREFIEYFLIIFNFEIPDLDNRITQMKRRRRTYHPYLNQLIKAYENSPNL